MRWSNRTRLAVAAVVVVAALAWLRPTLEARPSAGGMGAQGAEEAPPAPRVYFKAPVTAGSAQIWLKLQQKVPMKFAQETPLEEVIKAIKQATADPKEMPDGLPIYIDPVGLQEADKTLQSPIAINLEGIRLETALQLVLKQLDLVYHVHPDGLLIITAASAEGPHGPDDATALILDKLDRLEKQVTGLQAELVRAKR